MKTRDYALFSLGGFGITVVTKFLTLWLVFRHSSDYDVALVGAALFLSQIIDGIVDPWIGSWADRLKARGQARKQLMLIATLPCLLFFVLAFYPGGFPLLVLAPSLFRAFYSLYVIPYSARIPEITKPKERARLSTWISYTTLLGATAALALSGALIERLGFEVTLTFITFLAGGTMIIACLVKETASPAPKSLQRRQSSHFHELSKTLKDRRFLGVLIALVLIDMGFNVMTVAIPFYVSRTLELGESWNSYLLGTCLLCTLAFLPFLKNLISKFGSKRLMSLTLIAFSLIYLGFGLGTLTPLRLEFSFLFLGLMGFCVASFLVLVHVMMGEVIDQASKRSGSSLSASYYGVYGLILKLGVGLSTLAITFGLKWTQQAGLVAGGLSMGFVLAGYWGFRRLRM